MNTTTPSLKSTISDIAILRKLLRSLFMMGDDVRPIVQGPIVHRFIGTQQNQCSLDAGCGRGTYTRHLLKYSKQVFALDYSADHIDALQRRSGHLDQLSLHVGSADKLPFGNEQFDLVTHCEVLEHIHDDQKVVSELYRVLQPGGRLVLSVPVPPAPIDDSEHVREGYTLEEISELLQEAGFEIIRHQYCMFNLTKNLITFQCWWGERVKLLLPTFLLLPLYIERFFPPTASEKNLPYDVVIEARKPQA
jgi:SAM-dependent methyltransferase